MTSPERHTATAEKFLHLTDIQKLNSSELNKLCERFSLDKALPKSVKVNAICHCMGLSTTGQKAVKTIPRIPGMSAEQLQEFESLTPAVLYSLTDWTTNLMQVICW